MAVVSILVPVLVLVGGVALVALVVRRGPRAGVADGVQRDVARRTAVLRWAGAAAGVVVALVAAGSGDLGTGLLVAAPLFGLCTLVGVIAGELTVRPPRGPTRTAALEVRRVRDYLPARLGRVVAAAGGVLAVLVIVTTAAGSPDDLGRAGRTLARQCTPDSFQSHGPWPGLYYTGRLTVAVLAGLLIAAVAVRLVVRRPRPGSTGDLAADDALRERAAGAVVGAVGVLLAIPLAGVSFIAALGLFGISCAPAWWTVAGWGLLALVPASLVMVGWCLVAVLVPAGRSDRRAAR